MSPDMLQLGEVLPGPLLVAQVVDLVVAPEPFA